MESDLRDRPSLVIYCHSCGVRGNLLTLIHGLETHTPPTGGRLKGEEFKAALLNLREISGEQGLEKPSPSSQSPAPAIAATSPESQLKNEPLHSNPKAKAIADLYQDLITDPGKMTPNGGEYFRDRQSWLTPELAEKWKMG